MGVWKERLGKGREKWQWVIIWEAKIQKQPKFRGPHGVPCWFGGGSVGLVDLAWKC